MVIVVRLPTNSKSHHFGGPLENRHPLSAFPVGASCQFLGASGRIAVTGVLAHMLSQPDLRWKAVGQRASERASSSLDQSCTLRNLEADGRHLCRSSQGEMLWYGLKRQSAKFDSAEKLGYDRPLFQQTTESDLLVIQRINFVVETTTMRCYGNPL